MEKISVKDMAEMLGGEICYGAGDCENTFISAVDIDSRAVRKDSLFVCIKGERADGHRFVKDAFSSGAAAALISEDVGYENVPEGGFCIMAGDTVKALQRAATIYRRKFDIPVVGVTGSVGKTTVKEMIALALSAKGKVLKTYGNKNSQIGVALMMFELDKTYDAAVIEMGISDNGEMEKLAKIAAPSVCVVTNIGVSHIERLGSRENIFREKLKIADGMPAGGGTLCACGDDDMLMSLADFENSCLSEKTKKKLEKSRIEFYGCGGGCAYRARGVSFGGGTEFEVDMAGKYKVRVNMRLSGMHNVRNAAAALAVADIMGADAGRAAGLLSEYRPMAMRGEEYDVSGALVIDDTYNASPDSVKGALNVLWDGKCEGKRYAVLADILELGDKSDEIHKELGRYIAGENGRGRKTDVLVTVGRQAGLIADEASKKAGIAIRKFDEKKDCAAYLKESLKAGDIAIVKGSRGMEMDKVVKEVIKKG